MDTAAQPRDDAASPNGERPELDVLVVGYGPVGATAACLLGRYGVRTLVIDRAATIIEAPRAIALDHEALRVLQLAGLGDDAFAKERIAQVRMLSPKLGLFARMDTSAVRDGHPQLVTFYQPELERALRVCAEAHPHVQVQLETTLLEFCETAHGVEATLERADGTRQRVSARYLLAADGSNSAVRRAIGQEFRGRTYAEDWLVVDVRNAPKPIDHVEFLCDHRRPTPHMIAPGGRQRWEFMLRPGEQPEQMESLENVRELLAPWGDVTQMEIERRAVYRFHARCCDAFQKGRVFLAGDAAHITPPFIGQGLVAGLRDVANLCWKLAWVTRGEAAPQLLATYDTERRPHAKAMIRLAVGMGKLVMPKNALQALGTHGALRLLRSLPGLARRLEQNDIKPPNRFRRGLLVRGRAGGELVRGGLFPQAPVRDANGCLLPSDDALGPALACVALDVDLEQYVTPDTRAAFEACGGRFVQLHSQGASAHGYTDITGTFARKLRCGWIAVVRPDRALLHDGPAHRAERVLREAIHLLAPEKEKSHAARASLRTRSQVAMGPASEREDHADPR
jgi:3-(3-hydroxy-phenyl)propionate hydroxylase